MGPWFHRVTVKHVSACTGPQPGRNTTYCVSPGPLRLDRVKRPSGVNGDLLGSSLAVSDLDLRTLAGIVTENPHRRAGAGAVAVFA